MKTPPDTPRRRAHRVAPARWTAQARIDTPLGPIRVAATARGLGGLWFVGQRHEPTGIDAPDDPSHPAIEQARELLAAYWRGEPVAFTLPIDAGGTAFQRQVWDALRLVPRGATTSYGALAAAIGRPCAVRAVGAAVGRNPLSIVVPCHRVIGAAGALTGYAGGLERKRALLAIEGVAR
jgi:methylated-DNA-[protein]-cysteine S-methyltransferase